MKTNKLKEDCFSCGNILEKKDPVWKHSDGRILCEECMRRPIDTLAEVYYAKTFKKAKEIIMEFDEGFDESFLNITYV